MIYTKIINLTFPEKNVKILIEMDYDNDMENDLLKFNKSFDWLYSLNEDNISNCDDVYNSIDQSYKKYDTVLTVTINDSYGYKKIYKKSIEKIITIVDTKIQGIIYNDGLSYNVYNINSVPDDIKKKILGSEPEEDNHPDDPKPTPPPKTTTTYDNKKLDLSNTVGLSSIIHDTVGKIDAINIDTSLINKMNNPDYELASAVKKYANNSN